MHTLFYWFSAVIYVRIPMHNGEASRSEVGMFLSVPSLPHYMCTYVNIIHSAVVMCMPICLNNMENVSLLSNSNEA